MFEELKGSNGCIVGSENYFKKLNSSYYFSNLIYNNYNKYKECIVTLCADIKKCLDEIYYDLNSNSKYLRYVQSTYRNNLEKYVISLNDICKAYGNEYSKKNSIVSLLTLSDSSTKLNSKASETELANAVKFVKSNSYLNQSSGIDLLKKAVSWGKKYAIDNKSNNLYFFLSLDKIFSKCDKDFTLMF
ncbi:MAG: hypothetical protein R3Y35_12985 [Clostridia bacterium]